LWILIYILFIISNIMSFFVPKRINKAEIYATCLFAYAYGLTADMIFDIHYDFYGYFQKGFQWMGLLGIILYFPSISFLFLNFYPLDKRIDKKALYIILWSLFSVIFEWISLQTDFFYYNGWKLWYSAISYPFIYFVLVINMRIIQRINR